MFITSKLNNGYHRPDDARRAFDATLSALKTDYVDLFLIHWPLPTLLRRRLRLDVEDARGVLRATGGRARSVSRTSNPHHLDELARSPRRCPAVNQIEVHPYLAQDEVRATTQSAGIAPRRGRRSRRARCSTTRRRAHRRAHGKAPAQVVLRWHIQRGDIVFPKSVSPERMKSNFEIFDFDLDDADMTAISGLDRGEAGRTGPNPDKFDYIGG